MTPEEWQKARLIGEHEDDERIESGDDEELDSDAAFDESDEERFAGFFSRKKKQTKKKKKPTVRFADVDLNEDEDMAAPEDDEEEEEEGDPDEFIDLLDVLDGKGEIDMDSDNEKPATSSKFKESEDEDEEESGDDEEEDDQDAFAPSDEDEPHEVSEEFQKFISGLDTTAKKRKADDTETTDEPAKDSRSRKRRLIAERTEAGVENEFRAHASGSKLQLDDLLAPLATQSSNLLSLKKNTKVLSAASTKTKALPAPLPQRTQERLDREAAYEQTKEEVDKWSATMKRIREAEHLSFPLQARSSGRVSNLELAAKFKPSTKLESSIDSLLKSAKMRDEDIEQTEDTLLKTNNLTVEEIAQRRTELRRMRELMFRAELKAKRINKIKSKAYRKIKRKEKEKLQEKMLEADGLDGESDTEEGRLKREIERARERATLKHKHTGKWAKQMKQRHLDEGGREEIEEMLHRSEQLRRKIQGVGSDESEEESSDEDEEEDVDTEDGILRIKKTAFDELKRLNDQSDTAEPSGKQGKNVFQMKFMKDAMAREQAAADRMADDFLKEMGDELGEGSDDEPRDGSVGPDSTNGILANHTGGRMTYRPGVPSQGPRTIGSLASDTSSVTLKSTDLLSAPASPQEPTRKMPSGLSNTTSSLLNHQQEDGEESNPWLVGDTKSSAKGARRKNEVFGKDSQKVEKSKNKLKKLARKQQTEREKAQEDAVVEISMDQNLTLKEFSKPTPSSSKSTPTPKQSTLQTNGTAADGDDSDADSEVDAQEAAILKTGADANPKGLKAFQQRNLVALAFAGDNVVHEFEEAKKREVAADAPKDVDTTIPGWGSWGGQGAKRAPPKLERIKKIAGIDPKSRADYDKKHVIISEKRDKKAAKYLIKDLPYPYTSRAQFERSMEQPLGKEWNTRVGFQRGTLPRVVKKPGVIIDPLEKMV
ncbi:small-subunit processome [Macrolepiota fuliginosa MF-IS2]|uniref:Small-subunit processome n=1 Tax=Macrolepiota fuliginosa MF-IS2 TaxID=1400762 RepID=A0A9P5XAP8_9AGAR|nr:small-subunit processome [Macrolepiota fuliginosa MF-IS2]